MGLSELGKRIILEHCLLLVSGDMFWLKSGPIFRKIPTLTFSPPPQAGRGGKLVVYKLAERVGFEPTVEETPTHALQACLIDHSSTSPRRGWDSNPRSDIIGDRFSRAAPSTTRSPLLVVYYTICCENSLRCYSLPDMARHFSCQACPKRTRMILSASVRNKLCNH